MTRTLTAYPNGEPFRAKKRQFVNRVSGGDMTYNEIRAAFATIANNTKEEHTRQFALEQFNALTSGKDYNVRPFDKLPDDQAKHVERWLTANELEPNQVRWSLYPIGMVGRWIERAEVLENVRYHSCPKCGTSWNADIDKCPTCPPNTTTKLEAFNERQGNRVDFNGNYY